MAYYHFRNNKAFGCRLFFYTYGDDKGYKFDEQQGWVSEDDGGEESDGRRIPANTEFGEVCGMIADLQGAFSFKDITENMTIPQVRVMLMDMPRRDYSNKPKRVMIKSAAELLGNLSGAKLVND